MLDRQPISQHIQGDCGAFLMPLRGCYGGCPVGGKPPPSPPRGYTPKTAPTVAHDRFSSKIRTFLQGPCRKIFSPKISRFFQGAPPFQKKGLSKNFFPQKFQTFFHGSYLTRLRGSVYQRPGWLLGVPRHSFSPLIKTSKSSVTSFSPSTSSSK